MPSLAMRMLPCGAIWQCCWGPVHVLAVHAPCLVIPPTEELNICEGKPTRMTLVDLSDLAPHAPPCVTVPCVMGGADWVGRVTLAALLKVKGCSTSGAVFFGRGGLISAAVNVVRCFSA